MAKKTESFANPLDRFNRVRPGTNVVFSAIFIFLALLCVIPALFVVIISFSDESSIAEYGYQFIPKALSLSAYEFLWDSRAKMFSAIGVSILVTVVGTVLGIYLTATMGYIFSRQTYKLKKFVTYFIFIPMIFSGGLIASYYINVNALNLKDSLWVLILPLAVSPFNIVICRTFFQTTIPDSIIESAKIDGASQMRIFYRIVLPVSLPVLATIGIFLAFGYWNDWFQSLMYIETKSKLSLQALLMQIDKNIEFMAANAEQMGVSQLELISRMPKESYRMAICAVVIVPITMVYPFFQRYFISGLTIGAVKG